MSSKFVLVVLLAVQAWSFEDCYHGSHSESWGSGANDVIVGLNGDDENMFVEGKMRATPLHVRVGLLSGIWSFSFSRKGKEATLFVNDLKVNTESKIVLGDSGEAFFDRPTQKCTFTSIELEGMRLKDGPNHARLVVNSLSVTIRFSIFLLKQTSQLVIFDIGGTISKSGGLEGVVLPVLGIHNHHNYMVELLHKIQMNGYIIVYLTSRPMVLGSLTREYLFKELKGSDPSQSIPEGPLFLSPKSGLDVVWESDPSISKTKTLRAIVAAFFGKKDVVYAGFGDKDTDTAAYTNIGITRNKIFTVINGKGDVRQESSGRILNPEEILDKVDLLFPEV